MSFEIELFYWLGWSFAIVMLLYGITLILDRLLSWWVWNRWNRALFLRTMQKVAEEDIELKRIKAEEMSKNGKKL